MKGLGWLFVLSGVLIGIIGIVVLAVHVLLWLRTGDGSPLGIGALFWGEGELHTGWLGLDHLANYYRGFPVGMLITLFGTGIAVVGAKIVDRP
ncbi:hypothetical protein S23_05110 [Bradyrhizobium cosmicum]|uniref:Uncharacterized protein n=2 Tax=Bradyrhizobium cosmicum TaxID=1404864 RepID=A0AAI8Q908_9BRAD|nr:hypothetical protein S23_05110 [Bradyrhizobium cosmicum]